MKLSKEAIIEFKQIFKEEYGIELSDGEALAKGMLLLRLMKAIYKPINKTIQNNNYGK